jgi:hypothetical protein
LSVLFSLRWPAWEERGAGYIVGEVKVTSNMAEINLERKVPKLNPFHTF